MRRILVAKRCIPSLCVTTKKVSTRPPIAGHSIPAKGIVRRSPRGGGDTLLSTVSMISVQRELE